MLHARIVEAMESRNAEIWGEILHPDRMARLVVFGSMGDYPGLEEVVDRLVDFTWGAGDEGDDYRQRILHVTQRAVADHMMQQAARSTTAGTPVKSCRITRPGVNEISVLGSALGSQCASARISSRVTSRPSSWRNRFSRRILSE